MSINESGRGSGHDRKKGENGPEARIEAYLEEWLHYAAKRRYEQIEPKRLEQLEQRFIESALEEGLLADRGVSFIERIRAALFGSGWGHSAEPMVVGRGVRGRWPRWLLGLMVLLGMIGGAWLLWVLIR